MARLLVLFLVAAGCDDRADAVADLRRRLAAAKRVVPAPSDEPWAAEGPEVPMREEEIVEVFYEEMDIPDIPLEWSKTSTLEREKLRRWLRSGWLHQPLRDREHDPARVRFAIVYRSQLFVLPSQIDAENNVGGRIDADVTVLDLSGPKALCRAPVQATNGSRLSFVTGGPAGLTPQEAMEVDLRRNLRERAQLALAVLGPCRALPRFE